MEDRPVKFLLGATNDVLPSLQNLKHWVDGDPSRQFRSEIATLKYFLSVDKSEGCRQEKNVAVHLCLW